MAVRPDVDRVRPGADAQYTSFRPRRGIDVHRHLLATTIVSGQE